MAGSKGSWDKTQEAMESQGSSTFLRLESDGDKAVVIFCGAPFHRDICYNEKTKQYEAWDEAAKAAGRKKSSRYAMNVFVISIKGVETNEMKVIDMNFNTMTSVLALKDKYGLGKCPFEITRSGAKGDTKTQYNVLPEAVDITDAQRALCGYQDPKDKNNWIEGTMALIDLEEATAKDAGDDGASTVTDDVKKAADKKPKAATNGTAGAAHAPAAAPAAASAAATAAVPGHTAIDKTVAAAIIDKLKPLDRDKGLVPFFAKFSYAKKVSEIRAADEAAAVAYATQLAAPAAPAAAEDPFS
jgi:hypothetical protein